MAERIHGWMSKEQDKGNYSKGPGNVKIRWWNYLEYAQPHFDMHGKIIDKLRTIGKLTGKEKILDIGAGDGSFLIDLRHLYKHTGELTGLEPHLEQMGGDEELNPGSSPPEELYDIGDIEILKGRAQSLPFPDDTFDGIFALRMMYEVPLNEQHQVMKEIKRALVGEGFLALTTSGLFNKPEQRKFEEGIAHFLGIKPPSLMNAAYTAQRAALELPRYFNHVEPIWQDGALVYKTLEEAKDYYQLFATMQDQFDPIPNGGALQEAINVVVRKEVEESIELTGDFKDPIELAGFICWD